jgi:hypothetical protein
VKPVVNSDPNLAASAETTLIPNVTVYVTIETPYITPELVSASNTTNPLAYRTLPPVTQIQEDYVIIYSVLNQPFSNNKTALSFDLINPPMLIDFSLSVNKVTRNIEGDSRSGTNDWTSYKVENNDPNAYFEVTVREKSINKIVFQDGFGQIKQYGSENPRHLKLLRAGNYLIEFGGNKLTANVNLSVKREGNINQSIV